MVRWCPCPKTLHVVLPYFNYCGYRRRRELFVQFVQEYSKIKGVELTVIEIPGPVPLPRLPVARHFKYPSIHPIWIKENLINIAVARLPKNWTHVAWIDADIEFTNKNWVQDTLEALDTVDVVQMWHTAVNLGPLGEAFKTDKSFGYMAKGSGTPWVPNDKYGFWHPGYAWACTRAAWTRLGGLPDWAILGSGDRHLAMALIGRALASAPGNIHDGYKMFLREYQACCSGLRLGWVPGTIIHYWHGSLESRRYRERWEILTKNNFNPVLDLDQEPNGTLHLSETGLRLVPFLREYFIGRQEDSSGRSFTRGTY